LFWPLHELGSSFYCIFTCFRLCNLSVMTSESFVCLGQFLAVICFIPLLWNCCFRTKCCLQANVLHGRKFVKHIRKPGPDHAVQNNGLSLTEPGTLIRVFLNKNEEKNNKLLFVCKKILNPGERSAIPR
jgi:hypothetical protein